MADLDDGCQLHQRQRAALCGSSDSGASLLISETWPPRVARISIFQPPRVKCPKAHPLVELSSQGGSVTSDRRQMMQMYVPCPVIYYLLFTETDDIVACPLMNSAS